MSVDKQIEKNVENVSLVELVKCVKKDAPLLASTSNEQRNKALSAIAEALRNHADLIFAANQKDLEKAKEEQIEAPVLKRLKFDQNKLKDVLQGIEDLIQMPDPLFQIQMARQLDEGLTLYRETCPIGVIGVIFEARPDALVQISALCMKSGNCVILKGGSEALESNRILFSLIQKATIEAGLPAHCMLQLEARSEINQLLDCHGYVDLLIPRGSNAFVQYIMSHTKIPVMGHADGICHIYVDEAADIEKAVPVIIDAKTQYVSACNTVETLLIHEKVRDDLMKRLMPAFQEKNVQLKASEDIALLTGCEVATQEDDRTEYLDYIISAKTVSCMEEAIDHINTNGSHHTDCIITEDKDKALQFMRYVDSASVYQNCSTRFADGYRYGFGAEVGISTSKLHARGPVGLEGLLSYKYKLFGDGHIVDDYAEGRKQFHFADI